MTGSSEPVQLSPDQVKQTQKSNIFNNSLETYIKEGKLVLEGTEPVNGKEAFKIKANLEEGNTLLLFIDKSSFFLLKTSITINEGGMKVTPDFYMTDYTDNNGIFLPMKTTTSAKGMGN